LITGAKAVVPIFGVLMIGFVAPSEQKGPLAALIDRIFDAPGCWHPADGASVIRGSQNVRARALWGHLTFEVAYA
jgi:hypothetical protein